MAKPTGKLIFPWSFTKLSIFEQCPYKAKLKFIDKLLPPEKEVFAKGNEIHDILESFIKDSVSMTDVNKVFTKWKCVFSVDTKKVIQRLKKQVKLGKGKLHAEENWGLDEKWKLLRDWFGPNTWARIKVDCCVVFNDYVEIVDYKTGRMYPEHEDQAMVYSVAARQIFGLPVTTTHLYLEYNAVESKTFEMKDLKQDTKNLVQRLKRMAAEKTFDACSGDYCKWCEFSSKRQGACEEWR